MFFDKPERNISPARAQVAADEVDLLVKLILCPCRCPAAQKLAGDVDAAGVPFFENGLPVDEQANGYRRKFRILHDNNPNAVRSGEDVVVRECYCRVQAPVREFYFGPVVPA